MLKVFEDDVLRLFLLERPEEPLGYRVVVAVGGLSPLLCDRLLGFTLTATG